MTPPTQEQVFREALTKIAYLRPVGDVNTCKNPRQLIEKIERIAFDALGTGL